MAEYRRFVAYVYEYHKGKKGSNCGFIRVEARDRLLRAEVHLKCPGLIPDVNCSVYGFTRGRGTLEGHLVGNCRTAEGRADCVLETERNRIGGQDVSLEQLGGMILVMENDGFFGTEWDDQPIRPENFRENRKAVKMPEEKIRKAPDAEPVKEVPKESLKEPDKEGKVRVEKTAEKGHEAEPVIEPENSGPSETEKEQKPEKSETEKSAFTEAGSNSAPEALTGNSGKEADTGNIKEVPDLKVQSVDGVHEEASEIKGTVPESRTEPSEPDSSIMQNEESEEKSSVWEPFSDGELTECRKIGVQDLGNLGRQGCCLRNNRFLQHGFYQFGHLLLCKDLKGQYMLGVPGGYSGQERYMANMFGFPWFKESSEIEIPGCRGGYWYRYMGSDARRR